MTKEQFIALQKYIRADSSYVVAIYTGANDLVVAGERLERCETELAEAFGVEGPIEWKIE